MKELAQLPTPTIATRTLSSRAAGAVCCRAPLLLLMKFDSSSWIGAEWRRTLRQARLVTAPSLAVDASGCAAFIDDQLAPHVPDALEDGERGQRGHHVDRRREQVDVADQAPGEHQADRKYHHADRPGGDADLALDPERLGPGARVGDHQRAEHDDHAGRGREVFARRGEVAGDGGEHDALLDPVEGRVEEGAEQRALARHPRVAAVERVHHRADDERDAAEDEQPLGDQDGGDQVADQADHRDRVRRQPRLDQPVAGLIPELLGTVTVTVAVTARRCRRGRLHRGSLREIGPAVVTGGSSDPRRIVLPG